MATGGQNKATATSTMRTMPQRRRQATPSREPMTAHATTFDADAVPPISRATVAPEMAAATTARGRLRAATAAMGAMAKAMKTVVTGSSQPITIRATETSARTAASANSEGRSGPRPRHAANRCPTAPASHPRTLGRDRPGPVIGVPGPLPSRHDD